MNPVKILLLMIYYGFARHLPASNHRFSFASRWIRRMICKGIFKSAGININIENGAYFGTGSEITIGNNSI
jgi:maltose O-acetyltransferase